MENMEACPYWELNIEKSMSKIRNFYAKGCSKESTLSERHHI